jgi:hypothetical protein
MHYLLIGGPAHGTERDISNGDYEVTILSPSPGNPIPSPFKYIRREIQAETQPGRVFERTVFIEQSVSPDIATQALAAILLQEFAQELVRNWMEGGVEVGNSQEPEPSGIESERLQRGASGSRDTASGIIVASH